MPLALLMASLSVVVPCSVRTSRGMIWTLTGRAASGVRVWPTPGTWLRAGPELLLFGPLPSSRAAVVVAEAGAAGFGRCAVRDGRRTVLDDGAAVLRLRAAG